MQRSDTVIADALWEGLHVFKQHHGFAQVFMQVFMTSQSNTFSAMLIRKKIYGIVDETRNSPPTVTRCIATPAATAAVKPAATSPPTTMPSGSPSQWSRGENPGTHSYVTLQIIWWFDIIMTMSFILSSRPNRREHVHTIAPANNLQSHV